MTYLSFVPGHALYEKGLQRQIGVGTLVSSQERRGLAVPSTNRGSTAGQPLVNRGFSSSVGLHRISFVRASEETSRTVSSIRWRARGRVVSWPDRPDGVPSYPAPTPLAAPPCAAPTRPARSVSGFWIRQVYQIRRSSCAQCNSAPGKIGGQRLGLSLGQKIVSTFKHNRQSFYIKFHEPKHNKNRKPDAVRKKPVHFPICFVWDCGFLLILTGMQKMQIVCF